MSRNPLELWRRNYDPRRNSRNGSRNPIIYVNKLNHMSFLELFSQKINRPKRRSRAKFIHVGNFQG